MRLIEINKIAEASEKISALVRSTECQKSNYFSNLFNTNIFYKRDLAIIKWEFSCKIFRRDIYFDGLSEVTVKNGKVKKHLDFWDSGKNFYTQIPIFGRIFKKIHKI